MEYELVTVLTLMGIHHHRVSYPGFDFEKQVDPVVVQDSR